MDISEVFLSCVDTWAQEEFDDRIGNAIDKFEVWISNFDTDERELLVKLLQKFNYYSRSFIAKAMKELSEVSIRKYNISNEDSVVSVVRKVDGKCNSSYRYWFLHGEVSGLSKEIYYDSVEKINEIEWNNINKVVYVDDCSGTGKQFVKFMQRQSKSFRDKQVVLITIETIEDAKTYIKNEMKKNEIDVEILAYTTKEKGLKDLLENERKMFYDMSQRQGISEKYISGFEDAEALMAFYNNTPNDTLGLFWFLSEKNIPIFPRDFGEMPGWKKSKKEKEKRRRQQYEAKCS